MNDVATQSCRMIRAFPLLVLVSHINLTTDCHISYLWLVIARAYLFETTTIK
jgi:hypothetical protein